MPAGKWLIAVSVGRLNGSNTMNWAAGALVLRTPGNSNIPISDTVVYEFAVDTAIVMTRYGGGSSNYNWSMILTAA